MSLATIHMENNSQVSDTIYNTVSLKRSKVRLTCCEKRNKALMNKKHRIMGRGRRRPIGFHITVVAIPELQNMVGRRVNQSFYY
ncbi:Hypothetical predicted protein [Octopus vulgaris]|uniref:Uncharacterized protein n=1 Tax=Octopus vulgaris TaxID=6645 RepID=A0AA36BH04_OCTVU|nr:Hypothetical predicted protein [Octopus vulgaris]